MKEEYQELEMEIIVFASKDVITTSGYDYGEDETPFEGEEE